MADKVKVAVNWAAACGGCDVSILDIEETLLEVAEIADIVYWPVAMDFKRADLAALPADSVDVGLFNGAVRTSEQEEDAHLLREKCRLLVAYGSCACYGGIPGLGNVSDREGVFQTVYRDTPSTDNPDDVTPATRHREGECELELPEFYDAVEALHQVVDVDYFMPGCPPTMERVLDLVGVLKSAATGGELPPPGSYLASDKGLCDECPRGATRGTATPDVFVRPHQVAIDSERCLLDQGVVCMGIATRGGCGAKCIAVNMPCRGCYGPLPGQLDPAAELVSAMATVPGPRGAWTMDPHKIVSPARTVADPLGTFYRFTYAVSLARRTVRDQKRGG
jgi:F420-non-reducing hydrogenase small subunit